MIILGDARQIPLVDGSVRCVVTSPPYWGLRRYEGIGEDQIGLEPTPAGYVRSLVEVGREIRRVLTVDGTLWLNLGDCYCSATTNGVNRGERGERLANGRGDQPAVLRKKGRGIRAGIHDGKNSAMAATGPLAQPNRMPLEGLKPKDLVGMPWRVAFALQEDGWYLRSDIVWAKPNPMPESVTDRPTKAHEYLFLLAKSARYYYDGAAAREPYQYGRDHTRHKDDPPASQMPGAPIHRGLRRAGNYERKRRDEHGGVTGRNKNVGFGVPWVEGEGRNARTVWTIPTTPYPGAHYAVFPEEIPRRCILAGSAPGDVVLDPFAGSGTTVKVAYNLGRRGLGLELSPTYAKEHAARRTRTQLGLGMEET